ncbi:MAG: PriCT-2 domain-containing protein [Candidatus Sedimenticola sp. (ex Thyasira tokunagai)]
MIHPPYLLRSTKDATLTRGPVMDVISLEQITSMLSVIPSDDRDTWVRIGMGIKSELGEDGFSVWDDWSSTADNYSEKAARATWRSFKSGNIGIGTLIYLAKEHGWQLDTPAPPPKPFRKPPTSSNPTKRYALEVWLRASNNAHRHPYAVSKGITWEAGAKRGKVTGSIVGSHADCLIIPVRDLESNKVMAIQAINHAGIKQTFGGLSGNAFICGNTLNRHIPWFVVEGWADAISMVFHHYKGNAVAFAACGKSMMPSVANRVAEVFKPDAVTILEDGA